MFKIVLNLLISFVFAVSTIGAADNIRHFNIGKFKVVSLLITSMNHDKSLFRYRDTKELEKILSLPNSNSSAINVFVVDTGDHKILFDTGTNAKVLLERLKEINIDPKGIDIICITHMHFDHIGGLINDYNRTFPKTTIYIAKEEADVNKSSDLFLVYGERIKLFSQNSEITPAVKSIPAFGHTPGHTMFSITSEGETLMVWGDILHAPLQFMYPDIYMTYDTDPIQTLSTRKKVLKEVSDNQTRIAGAHLLDNGIGTIEKDKTGYKFVPIKIVK